LYGYLENFLCRFESSERLPDDGVADFGDAEVLVMGMGRVGRSAYRTLAGQYGKPVCGVDVDAQKLAQLRKQNYNVIMGDGEDLDFWRAITSSRVSLVMLALPMHSDALLAAKWLKTVGYHGHIGAVAKHEDEREALLAAGVDAAFNYYAEVGIGFADHVQLQIAEPQAD